jgi:hypothetical protein
MGLKKMYLLYISPLSSTHLWLRCSNFFNPSKKNSFGFAANRKSQRLISTPTYKRRGFLSVRLFDNRTLDIRDICGNSQVFTKARGRTAGLPGGSYAPPPVETSLTSYRRMKSAGTEGERCWTLLDLKPINGSSGSCLNVFPTSRRASSLPGMWLLSLSVPQLRGICIQGVLSSNLGRGRAFHWYSSIPPGNCRGTTSISPQPFPSKSFTIHQPSYSSTLCSLANHSVAKSATKIVYMTTTRGADKSFALWRKQHATG